jgi:hypothetical protein
VDISIWGNGGGGEFLHPHLAPCRDNLRSRKWSQAR